MSQNKIRVDIWSDIVCPFCYIGKRRFEAALHDFSLRGDVEINWRSFQLDPRLVTQPSKNTIQHLAETKNWSLEYAADMVEYVSQMAAESGLTYHLEKSIVANSFDAHRLIQLSKKENKAGATEEGLFSAYFTEAKNIADHEVLLQTGIKAGLQEQSIKAMLASDQLSGDVRSDMLEAQKREVRGVPYFLFNGSFSVSGAQDSKIFSNALEKASRMPGTTL